MTFGFATFLSVVPAIAQVVQLPSVRNFSYSGSAWVPDGGTTSLGGVGYESSSIVGRGWGPYGTRARGGSASASGLSVSVEVIDLQALDNAILSNNVPVNPNSPVSANSPAFGGARTYVSGSNQTNRRLGGSLNQNSGQWQRVLGGGLALGGSLEKGKQPSQIESNIRYYLRQGKEAEQQGRIIAARVYYRMAVEAMTPEMVERYQRLVAEQKAAEAEKQKQDLQRASKRF